MKKIIYSLALLGITVANAQEHWSYEGDTSPEHWAELGIGTTCGVSKSQSPINIYTENVKLDKSLPKLSFNYDLGDIKDIEDNGHSLQFDFKEGSYITFNGKKYALYQFHAHEESEHTIDGVRYPLELHFVHIAEDKSVTVIGVMVKEGSENSYFERLKVFKTLEKGAKEDTDIEFNPEKLFPKNKDFYTYQGSLTTPPCSDNVTWIVFKNPITLSENEVNDIAAHLPKSNTRPIQPLNGRTISANK